MRTNKRQPLTAAITLCAALAGVTGCASGGSDQTVLAGVLDPLLLPSPTEAAMDMLDVDDADNRRRGLSLIATSPIGGEVAYVKTYRELLRDPDPTVRAAAARALGLHGEPDDALLLAQRVDNRTEAVTEAGQRGTVTRYNEPDALARWEAAKALQKIHNPRAADALINAMMRDADADVRAAAARALGQYAQPTVFDPLLSALTDPQYRVARAAQASLTTLTGEDLGPDPDAWTRYRENNREAMFADRQTYTYDPWVHPPGFFQRIQPWSKTRRERIEPRVPTGM